MAGLLSLRQPPTKENTMKKAASVRLALALASVAAMATNSFAAAVVDYTGIGTAVTAELTPAIASVIPIAGTLIAIGVGWKMVKRFTK
jgi:hypothetical protein